MPLGARPTRATDQPQVATPAPRQLHYADSCTAQTAHRVIDERIDIQENTLPIMTMPLAKGLEFRAVIVMACDEQVMPQYESFGSYDQAEIDAIHTSERQLLYVACTRAREELVISYSDTPSMFLLDMRHQP